MSVLQDDDMGFIQVFIMMLNKVGAYLRNKAQVVRRGGAVTCLSVTTLVCLIPLVATGFIFKFKMPDMEYYILYIDTQDDVLFTVDERFLSLGLDSTVVTDGFKNFNMTDPKLVKMMKYLSPAYLRIGGNQADQIVFCRDGSSGLLNNDYGNTSDAFTLAASDWLNLYDLAREANISIIYDLNSLLRYDNGSWNSDNAQEMIQFSQEKGLILDWELGNEPNSYPHKFNSFVNATQLGIDYINLREILNRHNLYENSLLIGPSTTRLRTKEIEEYFYDFLASGSEAVSAITFHHYYFSGENATWEQFVDPVNFDYLEACIVTVKNVISLLPSPLNKSLWLGETSSAWHGGASNLSDRFIGSFLWVDKLGRSAKLGIDLVVRQSIFKGSYALLNDTYYPNPDWWLSVLYKKLVGPKVIATQAEGASKIRLYAHCAQQDLLWVNGSSVVVFGANFGDKTGYVMVKELRSDTRIYAFEFASGRSLFSQFVRLNGELLRLKDDLKLPLFKPKEIERGETLQIPLYTIIFWIFTNTNVEACAS